MAPGTYIYHYVVVFLVIYKNFLKFSLGNRTQRVILNSQCSNLAKVNAGARRGFILGIILLLTYINNLQNLQSPKLFADDTYFVIGY